MSAEAERLLELARGDRAGAGAGASPEPARFLELAQHHQVDALAYWNATRHGCPVGGEVLAGLKRAFQLHTVRNEVLLDDLAELARALRRCGVEPVVFKGPWLAFEAWPHPGTRPVDDVDLGIREEEYRPALAALADLGFHATPAPPSSADAALRRAHYGGQIVFHRPGRRRVELHFRMVNVGPPSEESWLRAGLRSLPVGGEEILVPGPEAMLLHLLLHANQHAFRVLRLLFDVRFALEREAVDADELVALVDALRCRASAWHGLVLARDLAGATVPPELLARLDPGPLRRALFGSLWRVPRVRRLDLPRRGRRTEAPLLYLLEMGRLRDKARYVAGLVAESRGGTP